ncbi:azurin [Nitrosovibrio sp. Nv17]|uniref:azurin n=1 Tax=Nitrosovibrio sp. Nv17 TaxID=1855339 RepID=UPI0009086CCE|nr:azurin [Nitrosovibrio sp. Nv17]SFW15444.1 azurin [Nitrosovibrio sp. Nv17]
MKKCKFAGLMVLTMLAGPALAACEIEVESNDAMKFNKSSIDVPQSCSQFVVKLKHVGKMPKTSMGHNWVLAKTADIQGVIKDGITAGLNNQYVKSGDARVIAHTKIIGGGESDTATVDVGKLKAGEGYTFICSFPGHSAIMKGTLQVK